MLGTFTDNSLNLASGGGLTINPMQTLTLSSGGFLAQSGNLGVSGVTGSSGATAGFLSANGVALDAYTAANTTISSVVLGTAGLNKAGAGQLTLSNFEPYTGTTTVNQGLLQLAAATGVTNPIVVGVNTTGNPLVVNNGGTLDLNGNVQLVSTLNSTSATVNTGIAGGIITSSTGNGTLVTTTGGATSGISIQGNNVNFIRSGGAGNLILTAPQTYGGFTVIDGGGYHQRQRPLGRDLDRWRFPGQHEHHHQLLVAEPGQYRRLADGQFHPVEQFCGHHDERRVAGLLWPRRLAFQPVGGRSCADFGRVVHQFHRTRSNINTTAPDSATLTLGSLTANHINGATVEFAQNYQGSSSGQLGLLSDGAGRSENILVTAWGSTSPLTNNIIGGWATVASSYFVYSPVEFASYNPTLGVGALNTAGFAGYDATTLPADSASRTQNIRLSATATSALVTPPCRRAA